MDERVFRGFQFLFSENGIITISQPEVDGNGESSIQITLDDARSLIQCLREAITKAARRDEAVVARDLPRGEVAVATDALRTSRRRTAGRRRAENALRPDAAVGLSGIAMGGHFSAAAIDEAWRRAAGRCECEQDCHGHQGPCRKQLMCASRGKDTPMGWETHTLDTTRPARADNCRILCQECHKAAYAEGR